MGDYRYISGNPMAPRPRVPARGPMAPSSRGGSRGGPYGGGGGGRPTSCPPPPSAFAPPQSSYGPVPSAYEPTPTAYDGPRSAYEAAQTAYETPISTYQAARSVYEPAPTAYDAPPTAYEAAQRGYEAHPRRYEAPMAYEDPGGYDTARGYEVPSAHEAPAVPYGAAQTAYEVPPLSASAAPYPHQYAAKYAPAPYAQPPPPTRRPSLPAYSEPPPQHRRPPAAAPPRPPPQPKPPRRPTSRARRMSQPLPLQIAPPDMVLGMPEQALVIRGPPPLPPPGPPAMYGGLHGPPPGGAPGAPGAFGGQLSLHRSPAEDRAAVLLGGCTAEAVAVSAVSMSLEVLCIQLPEPLQPPVRLLVDFMHRCSSLLTRLVDTSRAHANRVHVLIDYLELVLPSIQKSAIDIRKHIDDTTHSKEMRWRTLYHKLTEEGGMPLPQRFDNYERFLFLLGQMLARDPSFDMNALEDLQKGLETLRDKQGIKAPKPLKSLTGPMSVISYKEKGVHWAEDIFSRPLSSRTKMKSSTPSDCFGPWFMTANMPPTAKILFRRTFDKDLLSVTVFLDPNQSMAPFLLVRGVDASGNTIFSTKGAHELCVSRDGTCLVLQRWSFSEKCAKLWTLLFFTTWEELVLFHCAFIALKCRGKLTTKVNPDEYGIAKEKRLFQASIYDDGHKHMLRLMQDGKTNGLRLDATVWEGDLRQCPVWTAFITTQSRSRKWLVCKTKNVVWLRDVQLYVFCEKYREEHMRQNKAGAFEIHFCTEKALRNFRDLIYPPELEPVLPVSTEIATTGPKDVVIAEPSTSPSTVHHEEALSDSTSDSDDDADSIPSSDSGK